MQQQIITNFNYQIKDLEDKIEQDKSDIIILEHKNHNMRLETEDQKFQIKELNEQL